MTEAAERRMLQEHGTKAFTLPPSAIVSTARKDLKLREDKRAKLAEPAEQYAFYRKHVIRAESPADLLKRVIDGRGDGQLSSKFNTRLLYSDEALLTKALRLAEGAL